jgi:hypothetical protein
MRDNLPIGEAEWTALTLLIFANLPEKAPKKGEYEQARSRYG